jgi:hypothetical protein
MINIDERKKYLIDINFFDTPTNETLKEYFPDSYLDHIAQRDQFFEIVKMWSLGEIHFDSKFMSRYTPNYKGKIFYFKNVGLIPKLESMQDPYNYKYFGDSHGRTYREFLTDYLSPNTIPVDQFSKPPINSNQVVTWDRYRGLWVVKYKEGFTKPDEILKINLYRKDFDSIKNQYYWILINYNDSFKKSDVEYFETNERYIVENGNITPFVSLNQRKYIIEPILKTDSLIEDLDIEDKIIEDKIIEDTLSDESTTQKAGIGVIVGVIGGLFVLNKMIKNKKELK